MMWAPAAQASINPGTVTVPVMNAQFTDLQLIGLDSFTTAAVRNGGSVVATDGPGGPLYDYNTPFHASSAVASDLTGVFLRWAEAKGSAWVVHRANVLGGGQADYDSADRPVAFTPTGWITYGNGTLRLAGPGAAPRTLLTGLTARPQVRADYTQALVLHQVTVGGKPHTRVSLISFAPQKVEVLADHDDTLLSGEMPTSIALTPNTVVWFAKVLPMDIAGIYHRRARDGGTVENIAQPTFRSGFGLVATDDAIAAAELRNNPMTGPEVHLWARGTAPGAAWREITRPAGGGVSQDGLRSSPDRIGFAVSGASAVAGVYTIGTGTTPTRIADISTGRSTVTDVSLQAGRLTYAARPVGAAPDHLGTPLYRATVTTGGTLTAAGPAPFLPGFDPVHSRTGTPSPGVSVSGDRTAVRVDVSGVRAWLADDPVTFVGQTGTATSAEQSLKRSGSYLLWDNQVYRGDDLTLVKDLTGENCRGTDIFGQFVVCNKPTGENAVIDVTGRFARGTNGAGIGPVAIWGLAVAWVDAPGRIQVQDPTVHQSLRTYTVSGGVHDLHLTEGAIWWRDDTGAIRAVDRDPRVSSSPISLGLKAPADVDDHLVTGLNANGDLQVRTLPFGLTSAYRPRLFDAVTPASFAPATADWKPVFDVTKPLKNVKVEIRSGTAVVANLTATGTTGTVRPVWNGKTTSGADAPAGAYTWTLTADARDGDGSVTNVDGAGAVSGTVYLTR